MIPITDATLQHATSTTLIAVGDERISLRDGSTRWRSMWEVAVGGYDLRTAILATDPLLAHALPRWDAVAVLVERQEFRRAGEAYAGAGAIIGAWLAPTIWDVLWSSVDADFHQAGSRHPLDLAVREARAQCRAVGEELHAVETQLQRLTHEAGASLERSYVRGAGRQRVARQHRLGAALRRGDATPAQVATLEAATLAELSVAQAAYTVEQGRLAARRDSLRRTLSAIRATQPAL